VANFFLDQVQVGVANFFLGQGWAWQTFFGSIDGRGKLFLGQSKAWQTFFGSIDVDVANFFWVNR